MTQYALRMAAYPMPKTQPEMDNLTNDLAMKFGSQGWALVDTQQAPGQTGPVLLFIFQKSAT